MCSTGYWIIYIAFVVVVLTLSVICTMKARKETKAKRDLAARKDNVNWKGEVTWTGKETSLLILVSLFGGILAAIVGIGGGVVYSPLLLELGIPPKVASSTAMMLVLYTSLSNVI